MGTPEQKCVHQNVAGAYSVLQSFVHIFSLHIKNERKRNCRLLLTLCMRQKLTITLMYKNHIIWVASHKETSHHYPCVKTVHLPYLYGECVLRHASIRHV